VTEQLRARVEALRQPLRFASSDNFTGIERIRDLGETLRRAVDRLTEVAPKPSLGQFESWRQRLAGFEQMSKSDQAVEVARGLRLCQGLAGRPAPVRKTRASASKTVELTASVETLKGIGPALARNLAERGIETVEDLIWLVPRRYDDVRTVLGLSEGLRDAEVGERIALRGLSTGAGFFRRGRRRWVDLRLNDPDGGKGRLVVRWFNAHGAMAKRFPADAIVVLSARLQMRGGVAEMANPDILEVTLPDGTTTTGADGLIPRYADVQGVPPATFRKACHAAVAACVADVPDAVPAHVAKRLKLGALAESLQTLHAPPSSLTVEEVQELNRGYSEWHRRLAFDELFVLGIAVAQRRRLRRADVAVPCPVDAKAAKRCTKVFPFQLTGAQAAAIDVIGKDLAASVPMNRLLQGDVGSGKTAVAFAAAHQVVSGGRQVAFMAPTEILAEQHYANIKVWAQACGMRAALLTASTPRPVRSSMLSLLGAGEVDLVIGTHALLTETVEFPALGLAIVDEQHRFGVAQRVRLRAKGGGDGAPHLLVMTATPIPRTLALTAYGDLDATVLDELPPGRQPVKTRVMKGLRGRDTAYRLVAKRVAKGQRAFVVCPLVEPRPDADDARANWTDATSLAERLTEELAPARVGLVHGRLPHDEREQAMRGFRDGELDVLVATTVIEVGVDVPEATVMVIEDAHRFGLSQLHQLRGRVGRGGGKSDCLLMARGSKTPEGARRLEIMASTTDGFVIAEEDLKLRGPGELLGARQAGLPKLRFGDLREHAELLVKARSEADRLLADDPQLERHEQLRELLARRLRGVEVYGSESG